MNFEAVIDELRSANSLAEFNAEVTLEGNDAILEALGSMNTSLGLIFDAIMETGVAPAIQPTVIPDLDTSSDEEGDTRGGADAEKTQEERREKKRGSIFEKLAGSLSGLTKSLSGFLAGGAAKAVEVGGGLLKGALLFAVLPALNFLLENEALRTFIKETIPKIGDFLGRFTEIFKGVLSAFEGGIMNGLIGEGGLVDAFAQMPITFSIVTGAVVAAIAAFLSALAPVVAAAAPFIAIGAAVAAVFYGIYKLLDYIRDALGFEKISDVIKVGIAYVTDAFANLANMFIDFGNMITDTVNRFGGFLGIEIDIPEIERLTADNAERAIAAAEERAAAAQQEQQLQEEQTEIRESIILEQQDLATDLQLQQISGNDIDTSTTFASMQLNMMNNDLPVPQTGQEAIDQAFALTPADFEPEPVVQTSPADFTPEPVVQTSPPANITQLVNTATNQAEQRLPDGVILDWSGKYIGTSRFGVRAMFDTVAEATRFVNADMETAAEMDSSGIIAEKLIERRALEAQMQRNFDEMMMEVEPSEAQIAPLSTAPSLQQNQELIQSQQSVSREEAMAQVTVVNAPSTRVSNTSNSNTTVNNKSLVNPDPFINGIATAAI